MDPSPDPKHWIALCACRAVLNQVHGKDKKKAKKRKFRGSDTPAHEERSEDDRERKRERKHKKHDKVRVIHKQYYMRDILFSIEWNGLGAL